MDRSAAGQEVKSGPSSQAPDGAGDSTLRQSLSAWHLVLPVVAAAAPMGAAIGIVPFAFAFVFAFAFGNGAGVPLTVLGVSVILALFFIGYSAMSRQVVRPAPSTPT